jgi:prepilin-type processing-associated H-X9-DG protein
MFAEDNHGQFPPQVSVANGGSLELIASNSPALHFGALSNYLRDSQRIWHCPADDSRPPRNDNGALTDTSLSYFVNVDATHAMTNAILSGDRNLESGGLPVKPGLFILTTNTALSWTGEMHSKPSGRRCGNMLFVDAHVQNLSAGPPLANAVQCQDLPTNRLAVP